MSISKVNINKKIHSVMLYSFSIILSLLYSIIAVAQILGFFQLYIPLLTIPLSIILSILVSKFYISAGKNFWNLDAIDESDSSHLQIVAYISGVILLFGLILWPLFRWPFSGLQFPIEWDAAFYHFPKAIELFRSGSFWDLSIPYGQYPNGYESLLSFGISILGNEYLFGFVHGLITLFLFLSIWLLGKRYTKISGAILFWGIAFVFVSGKLISYGNPWVIFTSLIYTIGKNDLFLGAVILAFLLHSPIGRKKSDNPFLLEGMAILTMIGISIKPNIIYVIAPIWAYTGFLIWRKKEYLANGFWKKMIVVTLITLPGILWIIRNLVVLQTIFTKTLLQTLNTKNVFSILFDPDFYSDISLIFVGLIFFGIISGTQFIRKKKPSLSILLTYYLLFFAFIITPATIHVEGGTSRILIVWRFGIALLGLFFILLLVLFEPLHISFFKTIKTNKFFEISFSIIILLLSIFIVWDQRHLLQTGEVNKIVLLTPYKEPSSNTEYRDVYDFIQQNIRNSNIFIIEGLPYFTYGTNFTNSPTKLQYPLGQPDTVPQLTPEFLLVTPNYWNHEWPGELQNDELMASWHLIYKDESGKVFQKD
ncbi:MAG: hypothetical protein HON98_04485 [Chloroflexi bacterium]|jgi:hypothetical protein|nr:hypothetical protein [Chloroflexota bacterium]MBT3671205.1 hypothetical protein [Chloroflexota bacterium]MBT4003559.1 hypothetical protein [Chloroflexota bacterium]MBT4304336.1 hypothetical protein [Chloroflexota bacterium]MBT4534355.1 hypothetical protein [Chloroflexota bacterium]